MGNQSKRCAAIAVLLACLGTEVARANMVVNGNFESTILGTDTARVYGGGSTAITGWTVLGSNVAIVVGQFVGNVYSGFQEPQYGMNAFNAAEGKQFVDLTGIANSGNTSGITQDIITTHNSHYLLTFSVGAALGDPHDTSKFYQTPAEVDLSINGGPRIAFITTPIAANAGSITWKNFSYEFAATGTKTTLTFFNGTPFGTNEAGLDNVSLTAITAVPLPAAAWAGLVLLGGLAVRQWRASRRAKS